MAKLEPRPNEKPEEAPHVQETEISSRSHRVHLKRRLSARGALILSLFSIFLGFGAFHISSSSIDASSLIHALKKGVLTDFSSPSTHQSVPPSSQTDQQWNTWCGKRYEHSSPVQAPGGRFPIPPPSSTPLFSFACNPSIKPYLGSDASGSIFITAGVTRVQSKGTFSVSYPPPNTTSEPEGDGVRVKLVIRSGYDELGSRHIKLGPTPDALQDLDFHIDLDETFPPRREPYAISCSAIFPNGEIVRTSTTLLRLPDPDPETGGSVVKVDGRSGALLVRKNSIGIMNEKKAKEGEREWQPIIPFGFFTSFDGYLAKNLSELDTLKARGYNMVHPVPTFANLTLLDQVLDRMEQLGLWLMYDMRHTYKNHTAMMEEVNRIKNRKNLLLWYTADEPDGQGDPLIAPSLAYKTIRALDGYHPVSIALNCENYYFREFTAGADVILHDTYTVGINATWSTVWDTPCTEEHGDCGCDNCVGDFADIARRLESYRDRLNWDSRHGVALWSVPQAFGKELYWDRIPSAKEFMVQVILSFLHGSTGIVPWIDPTTPDIHNAASAIAQALPRLTPFLLPTHLARSSTSDPNPVLSRLAASFRSTASQSSRAPTAVKSLATDWPPSLEIGIWSTPHTVLVLATNLDPSTTVSASFEVDLDPLSDIKMESLFGSTQAVAVVDSRHKPVRRDLKARDEVKKVRLVIELGGLESSGVIVSC